MTAMKNTPPAELLGLTAIEQERFVRVVESSLKVRSKSQFFLWAQGAVHGLLPHSMLICACGGPTEYSMVERFSDYPFPDKDFDEMCCAQDGLLARIVQWWRDGGEKPRIFPGAADDVRDAALLSTLTRYNLSNLAVHGALDLRDNVTSFFWFSGVPEPLGARHAHILELLLPYLQSTMMRFVQSERTGKAHAPTVVRHVLTEREVEILVWVQQGKSNSEIGQVLNISPLTVKNHVQNLLRKLNVQNRAQAVAKGHSLQILNASHPS